MKLIETLCGALPLAASQDGAASHVSDGPLALARPGYRAPICFHGNFLPV